MSAQPARSYYGIGEVLAQLSGEFPDVRVSKIRFLESEGLIEPARAPSGFRRFSRHDIERLRFILTAQRDQYLPLRVIREKLGSPGTGPSGTAQSGTRQPGPGTGGGMLGRGEFLAAAGIDSACLEQLEEFGLVRRKGRQYGQDALAVARLVGQLGGFGVQARHLRTMKAAAERETSLIEQVVAPLLLQRSNGAAGRARQTAAEIAALTAALHAALVEAELGEAGLA